MDPKPSKPAEGKKIETRPDGEDRFERAVDIAVKTPAIRKETLEKPSIAKR
jgi:hypothetical protein